MNTVDLSALKEINDSNQDFDWEDYVESLDFSEIGEDTIDFLITERLGLIALSHKDLSEKALFSLSKLGYEEALFTLGKKLSVDPTVSDEDFARFLENFCDNFGLFFQLLEYGTLLPNRKAVLIETGRKSKNNELSEYISDISLADMAASACEEYLIRSAFERREYHALLAIAANPNTPKDILEDLIHCSDIKFSKRIRKLSRENLRNKACKS